MSFYLDPEFSFWFFSIWQSFHDQLSIGFRHGTREEKKVTKEKGCLLCRNWLNRWHWRSCTLTFSFLFFFFLSRVCLLVGFDHRKESRYCFTYVNASRKSLWRNQERKKSGKSLWVTTFTLSTFSSIFFPCNLQRSREGNSWALRLFQRSRVFSLKQWCLSYRASDIYSKCKKLI